MPPVFAHGALWLYLLALLEEGPKHGYGIIKALGERFGGTYSPSAGTVRPRLSKLQEEGLVETSMDGRRTIYTITNAGREEPAGKREELQAVEENISASVRRLADDLRMDLRVHSARHRLAEVTVETLRTVLEQAAVAIRATLKPWGHIGKCAPVRCASAGYARLEGRSYSDLCTRLEAAMSKRSRKRRDRKGGANHGKRPNT